MSHIPAAAMPHAKPHEDLPEPIATPPKAGPSVPWAALIAGGVLAIGGVAAATWFARQKPERRTPARPRATRRKATGRRAAAKG